MRILVRADAVDRLVIYREYVVRPDRKTVSRFILAKQFLQYSAVFFRRIRQNVLDRIAIRDFEQLGDLSVAAFLFFRDAADLLFSKRIRLETECIMLGAENGAVRIQRTKIIHGFPFLLIEYGNLHIILPVYSKFPMRKARTCV